jgi:hypothetical protein
MFADDDIVELAVEQLGRPKISRQTWALRYSYTVYTIPNNSKFAVDFSDCLEVSPQAMWCIGDGSRSGITDENTPRPVRSME